MAVLPSMIYHKDVIKEYGEKLFEIGKKRILDTPIEEFMGIGRYDFGCIIYYFY